jgi:hypothetical protein
MSDQTIFWLVGAGVVTLAALLLWLRDRFRDFRHVPEAERKLGQQRNATGATAFVSLVWASWFVFHAIETAALVPRLIYLLVAIVLVRMCWQSYKQYQKIGRTK